MPSQSFPVSQQQQQWNQAMSEHIRLRVAFVLQTLLCLLRLYGNKQANGVSISVLRSIFDVGMSRRIKNRMLLKMK